MTFTPKGRAHLFLLLLIFCPIVYFLHPKPSPSPRPSKPLPHVRLPPRPLPARPIYEWTSEYRQHANKNFESYLDAKLRSLEPLKTPGLADPAIYQFTTPELALRYKAWTEQWRTNNKGWGYNLYTSVPAELLSLFSTIPQIAEVIERHPAIQADLVRYLTLWYYGGLFADIETWERVSLSACHPILEVTKFGADVSLMVGVGFDEPYFTPSVLKSRDWTRGVGFATPVIWAPKRFDPILRKAIIRSVSHARSFQELGGSIVEVSGWGMLTDVVLEILSTNLQEGHMLRDRDAGLERRVTWKQFKELNETIWIEPDELVEKADMRGLAILPIDVWGNGQSHSGSGPTSAEIACVNHIPGGATGS